MQYCIHCGEKNAADATVCTKCGKELSAGTVPPEESAADALDDLDARSTVVIDHGVTTGQTLAERYELVRELGRGAMGIVYFARDTILEMDVAIKVLPPVLQHDPRSIRQLKNEAQAAMRLSHPNIIRLYNFEQSDEAVFIVMEYIGGTDLLTMLGESEDERIPLETFLPMADQIISAVAHAHGNDVVHQDIKPANIMVTKGGEAKVADFGIAHVVRETVTRVSRVETAGTLLYMAPEVLQGSRGTPKSDQYALACTFYELLTGEPPFVRGDITFQHINTPAPTIEGAPAHVNTALSVALEKDPERRWPNVEAFGNALKEPVAGPEPLSEIPPPVEAPAATLDDIPAPDPKTMAPQDAVHLNGRPKKWRRIVVSFLLFLVLAYFGLAMLGESASKDVGIELGSISGGAPPVPVPGGKDPAPEGVSGVLGSDAPAGLERTTGNWTVQLGPYSGPDEAWPIYERWQARGAFAYIHSPLDKDRQVRYSAVWLGRYRNRIEAVNAKEYLIRHYSELSSGSIQEIRTDR